MYQRSDNLENIEKRFFNITSADYAAGSEHYKTNTRWTKKNETQMRLLRETVNVLRLKVISTEVEMNIAESDRWQVNDPRYLEVTRYSDTREYQRSLDHLQKLVVQRLFELQKLNIAGTGALTTPSLLGADRNVPYRL